MAMCEDGRREQLCMRMNDPPVEEGHLECTPRLSAPLIRPCLGASAGVHAWRPYRYQHIERGFIDQGLSLLEVVGITVTRAPVWGYNPV